MDYIKLSRKLMDWEWYGNINTCRLFIHMLLKANWKDGKFEGKVIPRGSFVSSIGTLAKETALTSDEVRTALKHLISTKEITKQSFSKFTVFTVKNYSEYQDVPKQNPNQIPSSSHSIPTLFPTIEERKEVKKGRNNNNSSVATTAEPKLATVTFTEDSFEIQCVDKLIDSCLKTFPNSKVPQTLEEKQKWAIDIDRMKRLDGRTEADIMQALNYAIKDSFWQGNIRSTKKFREKFETLIVRSQASGGDGRNKFNQFKQNDYDFDSLESELLSN